MLQVRARASDRTLRRSGARIKQSGKVQRGPPPVEGVRRGASRWPRSALSVQSHGRMNFPTLPATDNLYKFVALVGVTLIVLGILFPVTKEQELSLRIIQSNGDVAKYNIAVQHLNEDLAHAQSVLRNPIALNKDEVSARVQQKNRELQIQSAGIDAKKQELEELKQQLDQWRALCGNVVVAGIILAVIGFVLWYALVQHWQDRALRREFAGRG